MQERFHLDAPGWFGETEEPQASAHHCRRGCCAGSLIKIRYQSWRAEKQRRVAPLGLVLKGGSWYLAGHVDGSTRTYRVARVLGLHALDAAFDASRRDSISPPIGRRIDGSGSKPRCIRMSAIVAAVAVRREAARRAEPPLCEGTHATGRDRRRGRLAHRKNAGRQDAVARRNRTVTSRLRGRGAGTERLREKMAEMTGAMAARYAAALGRRAATRRA